ncbi:hypothetical protein KIPB_015601 [Kipferlia bialata]|uniref:N-acetyltransferase domain-containing protein n=1 Tax=Kipferlia bialata TaxID=797122 RepID=A0A9K3GQB5_9EUKA|nr:hypothetical protein KIPB_015601 [Kipferlia bialata]|eukprot:g15601.t1
MVTLRRATVHDLLGMQSANLSCLPENYGYNYYMYHFMSWPHTSYVAIDGGKVVGYVMAKIESEAWGDEDLKHGHITSVAVLRTHRRMGLATLDQVS